MRERDRCTDPPLMIQETYAYQVRRCPPPRPPLSFIYHEFQLQFAWLDGLNAVESRVLWGIWRSVVNAHAVVIASYPLWTRVFFRSGVCVGL